MAHKINCRVIVTSSEKKCFARSPFIKIEPLVLLTLQFAITFTKYSINEFSVIRLNKIS